MTNRCDICHRFVTKDHDKDECVENDMEVQSERKLDRYLDGKLPPQKNTGMEDYCKKKQEEQ